MGCVMTDFNTIHFKGDTLMNTQNKQDGSVGGYVMMAAFWIFIAGCIWNAVAPRQSRQFPPSAPHQVRYLPQPQYAPYRPAGAPANVPVADPQRSPDTSALARQIEAEYRAKERQIEEERRRWEEVKRRQDSQRKPNPYM